MAMHDSINVMAQHHWFDWIFFAIVGIPLVLACLQAAMPDLLEPFISQGQRRAGAVGTRKR
nr:hypothetical protein [uncultured Lichenicoccus sp.]